MCVNETNPLMSNPLMIAKTALEINDPRVDAQLFKDNYTKAMMRGIADLKLAQRRRDAAVMGVTRDAATGQAVSWESLSAHLRSGRALEWKPTPAAPRNSASTGGPLVAPSTNLAWLDSRVNEIRVRL